MAGRHSTEPASENACEGALKVYRQAGVEVAEFKLGDDCQVGRRRSRHSWGLNAAEFSGAGTASAGLKVQPHKR